jgi:MotA/TolQ/ExbB proton channel family
VRAYFEAGGPLMLPILGTWVVVLAAVLDRLVYAAGRSLRRPLVALSLLVTKGRVEEARRELSLERSRAGRRLERIDTVSQLATSLGLFGTVVGIAQSFFARGGELAGAAPEVLASGLSTALFTTIGGLVVFLFGQTFLIAWQEWQTFLERDVVRRLEGLRDPPVETEGGS